MYYYKEYITLPCERILTLLFLQKRYRSSMYELGSPDLLSDTDNDFIHRKKAMKTSNKCCSCQIGRDHKNEWTYKKISESSCDYETIIVKKRNPSTGVQLWHIDTYGHEQSCSIKNTTSRALAWRKLPKHQKQVQFNSLFFFCSQSTFPIFSYVMSFGIVYALKNYSSIHYFFSAVSLFYYCCYCYCYCFRFHIDHIINGIIVLEILCQQDLYQPTILYNL